VSSLDRFVLQLTFLAVCPDDRVSIGSSVQLQFTVNERRRASTGGDDDAGDDEDAEARFDIPLVSRMALVERM
jgi:hypothetical protein